MTEDISNAALPQTMAWFKARLGRPTASKIWMVMAKRRDGKPSQTRLNYIAELVMERRSTAAIPTFGPIPAAIQWGIDHEPAARERYVAETGNEVAEAPFVPHPTLYSGATPDGLVGDDGVLECKCPLNGTVHLRNLEGEIADEYMFQMQWQLCCTGRAWCDYVSFDPRWYGPEQINIVRVPRDDDMIAEMEEEVEVFLEEVDMHMANLDERAARRREAYCGAF
jgi:hypothetical protein